MIILFIFILLFAVVFGMLAHKSRVAGDVLVSASQLNRLWRRPVPSKDHRPAAIRRDFRAVSIKCGPDCCQAVKKLAGKRGFPSQIPRLPLSQCRQETCTCTYVQHADRRASEDRRDHVVGLGSRNPAGEERRVHAARRGDECSAEMDAFNFKDD